MRRPTGANVHSLLTMLGCIQHPAPEAPKAVLIHAGESLILRSMTRDPVPGSPPESSRRNSALEQPIKIRWRRKKICETQKVPEYSCPQPRLPPSIERTMYRYSKDTEDIPNLPRAREEFNSFGGGCLPSLPGFEVVPAEPGKSQARRKIRRDLAAPNGFLRAASIIALADTACGYGCHRLYDNPSEEQLHGHLPRRQHSGGRHPYSCRPIHPGVGRLRDR